MKKLIVAVLFLLLIGVSHAQQAYQANTTNIVATGQYCSNAIRCNITNTGAAFHQLTWTVSGTLSACSVQVDSSADGITWNSGDVIATQTCTSNGVTTSTSHIVNFIRVNVTAITPVSTANLAVNLIGYVNLPSGGGNLSGTLTTPRIPYATGPNALSDDSLYTWDATNHRLAIGGSIPASSNSVLNIIGATVTTLPNFEILESHASFQVGINMFSHNDTGSRAPRLMMNKSRGTQASPTVIGAGDLLGIRFLNGYNGTAYVSGATESFGADELWSGSTNGANFIFSHVRVTSTALAEVYRITSSGSSQSLFRMASATILQFNTDTSIQRSAAATFNFGNGTSLDTSAKLRAAAYMSLGTKFTQDTGCGTIVTSSGGATAGKFTTVGSTSCTTVITMGNSATAPNGWDCHALDLTTAADVTNPHQTTSSTTTATIATGTIVANDVIQFSCIGY